LIDEGKVTVPLRLLQRREKAEWLFVQFVERKRLQEIM
jgi:hypothetical protein